MILVVDDMDCVCKAIADCLRTVGYSVISNSTAAGAILDLRRAGSEIEFLITDLDFTGHGVGIEGFYVVREAIWLGLEKRQIIILSGLPPEKLPEDLGGVTMMTKPVRMAEVIKVIKAAGLEPADS